jgi:hypothetical protein
MGQSVKKNWSDPVRIVENSAMKLIVPVPRVSGVVYCVDDHVAETGTKCPDPSRWYATSPFHNWFHPVGYDGVEDPEKSLRRVGLLGGAAAIYPPMLR